MDDDAKVEFLQKIEASKAFSNIRVIDEKYSDKQADRGASNDHIVVALEATYSTI